MIKYSNLLDHSKYSTFWKTILERLSIEDAPFFSTIEDDLLSIDGKSTSLLGSPEDVVTFCKKFWSIPGPCLTWKTLKKEHTRQFLLIDYASRAENLEFSTIQKLLNEKSITGDDIVLEGGRIKEIRGI